MILEHVSITLLEDNLYCFISSHFLLWPSESHLISPSLLLVSRLSLLRSAFCDKQRGPEAVALFPRTTWS